jgi:hypothetical protein
LVDSGFSQISLSKCRDLEINKENAEIRMSLGQQKMNVIYNNGDTEVVGHIINFTNLAFEARDRKA